MQAAGRTQQFFFPAAGTVVGWLVVVGLGLESGWWMPPSYGWRPGAVRADEDARFYCGVLSFSLRLKFDPTFLLKFTSRGREPAW